MNKSFIIEWDFEHSGDDSHDAAHLPFEHSNVGSTLFLSTKYKDKLPKKVFFRANFNLIPTIDYPLTDLGVPVLNKKMLDIILSIGNVDYMETLVVMIDDTYLDEVFISKDELKPNIPIDTSYRVLTVVNRMEEYFDYDNSIFLPSELDPKKPGYIKKMVLRSPAGKFPPIFRIKENPSQLLISGETKEAFEKSNIKGCLFREVEVTPFKSS